MQGETESGCLRSKLSDRPKMMVGVLLESCGKNRTYMAKKGVRVGKSVVQIILGEIMAGASGAAAA